MHLVHDIFVHVVNRFILLLESHCSCLLLFYSSSHYIGLYRSYHDGEHYNSVRLVNDACDGPARPIIIKVKALQSLDAIHLNLAVLFPCTWAIEVRAGGYLTLTIKLYHDRLIQIYLRWTITRE